jgi:hypothetical protein
MPIMWAEQHPLGFLALRIKESSEYETRVHLWTPGCVQGRDSLGEVHDHTWHMESVLLVGTLRHQTLEIVPGHLPLWAHDYQSGSINQEPNLWDARVLSDILLSQGQSYSLGAGNLHRIEVLTPYVVTLVRTKSSKLSKARILGGQKPVSLMRTRMGAERALQLLTSHVPALRSLESILALSRSLVPGGNSAGLQGALERTI